MAGWQWHKISMDYDDDLAADSLDVQVSVDIYDCNLYILLNHVISKVLSDGQTGEQPNG